MKKKFVSSWIDNMGTGIQFSEGTYDPATKTFTYTSEMEMMPGMKTPVREVIKVTDNNHMMTGVVRNPWRSGKENHGNRVHPRRQEIAGARFSGRATTPVGAALSACRGLPPYRWAFLGSQQRCKNLRCSLSQRH